MKARTLRSELYAFKRSSGSKLAEKIGVWFTSGVANGAYRRSSVAFGGAGAGGGIAKAKPRFWLSSAVCNMDMVNSMQNAFGPSNGIVSGEYAIPASPVKIGCSCVNASVIAVSVACSCCWPGIVSVNCEVASLKNVSAEVMRPPEFSVARIGFPNAGEADHAKIRSALGCFATAAATWATNALCDAGSLPIGCKNTMDALRFAPAGVVPSTSGISYAASGGTVGKTAAT